MKCKIPEISWHNRDPVYSIDIQSGVASKNNDELVYRVATGGTDCHVFVWLVKVSKDGDVDVEFVSDLHRHQRAVNVVRFSPNGQILASGDDESVVMLWKPKVDDQTTELWDEVNEQNKENWQMVKILRGHVEDVYDLCWSPDSLYLISGSVDNSAIVWDVTKGQKDGILKDHKGFVQGVTWDPQNKYLATLSSDRVCRIFSVKTKKVVNRVQKSWLPLPGVKEDDEKVFRLFYDDTFKSFFRRLTFTPCGELLLAPSGHVELDEEGAEGKKITSNGTFVFSRFMFNKPAVFLPTETNYTIAVRCCPVLFELRTDCPLQEDGTNSMIPLPYRCIFAVATQDSVLLYDTQQAVPIGNVSNIHYTRLSDLSWSSDGLLLMVSSTDGFCSIVTFTPGELGTPYQKDAERSINVSMESEALEDSMEEEEDIKLVYEETQVEPPPTAIKPEDDDVLAKPLDDMDIDDSKMNVIEDDEVLAKPLDENTKSPSKKYESPKKSESANIYLTPIKSNQLVSPKSSDSNKTPKRATLITLSSPKSKKNLYKN